MISPLHLTVLLQVPAQTARMVVASPFDRELAMAHIKINESAGVADRIIFCEGSVTQSGYPRFPRLGPLKKHHPDVETCVSECKRADTHTDHALGWDCEAAPREAAKTAACRGEPDSTVVVLGDADEIVSRKTLVTIKDAPPPFGYTVSFRKTMTVHIYGFFWQEIGRTYSVSHATTCGTMRSMKLRAAKTIYFPKFSGWHCSYCFPVDEYLSKMHSMLKGDGWLSLSDHYWSLKTLWSFRQHGIPLNGQNKMSPALVLAPVLAKETMPFLTKNTNLTLPPPVHPFKFPK